MCMSNEMTLAPPKKAIIKFMGVLHWAASWTQGAVVNGGRRPCLMPAASWKPGSKNVGLPGCERLALDLRVFLALAVPGLFLSQPWLHTHKVEEAVHNGQQVCSADPGPRGFQSPLWALPGSRLHAASASRPSLTNPSVPLCFFHLKPQNSLLPARPLCCDFCLNWPLPGFLSDHPNLLQGRPVSGSSSDPLGAQTGPGCGQALLQHSLAMN